jgi:hypothetical protein
VHDNERILEECDEKGNREAAEAVTSPCVERLKE